MSLTLTRRHNVDRFGYLIPTRYGNVPMVGAVATYRPGEGRFGGAVAVEEGTTNLLTPNQRSAETDTSGWATAISNLSWAVASYGRTTAESYHGYASIYATTSGTRASEGVGQHVGTIVGGAGKTFTLSVYVKAPVGTKMGLRLHDNNAAGTASTSFTATGQWQRVSVTKAAHATIDPAWRWSINVEEPVAVTFYVDAVQLEAKPFATSFVDGTRAAGVLRYDPSVLNKTHGTIAAWFKLHNLNERYNGLITTSRASSPGPRLLIMREFAGSNANKLRVWDGDGATEDILTSTTVLQKDVWYHFAFTWSPSGRRFYINGSLEASNARSEPIGGSELRIGHWGGGDEVLNGLIDELLILPYAASDEEIRAWYEADGPIPPHPDALLQWDWQATRPATMVAL